MVLETDGTTARAVARRHLRRCLPLCNDTDNLRRLGFGDGDFEYDGSDRLIDALVVWGDEEAIAERIGAYREAGADQVCVQVLTQDFCGLPLAQWRRLAAIANEA